MGKSGEEESWPPELYKKEERGSRNKGRRDSGEKELFTFDDVIIKKEQRRIE